jgi:ADP-ribosylglycohydrolase
MLGAIAGDVIGSVHEGSRPKPKNFPLFVTRSHFTDDTVLTIAIASAIRSGGDFGVSIRQWGRRYPRAGYGSWFRSWLFQDGAEPYNSFGNGSAMRVAPVGWAFDNLDDVLIQAAKSAEVTHSHPEGIKGSMMAIHRPHPAKLAYCSQPPSAVAGFYANLTGGPNRGNVPLDRRPSGEVREITFGYLPLLTK